MPRPAGESAWLRDDDREGSAFREIDPSTAEYTDQEGDAAFFALLRGRLK